MPSIVVTGRDDRVSSRHKKHAEEKLSKLNRYFDGIVKIEAILDFSGDGALVEVIMSVRGGKRLVCQSRSKDLYAAIDLVLDKAGAQLKRHKEKLKKRKVEGSRGRRSGEPGAAEGAPEATDGGGAEEEDESYQDIVEKRDFS
jgi:ribosomal subunit interface protein